MQKLKIPDSLKFYSENDKNFFSRVFNNGDLNKYSNRLSAIGFEDMSLVLDAGSGYGQWTLSMALKNKNAVGIDIDENRIEISRQISKYNKIDNIKFIKSNCDSIPFDNNSVDAIFSYNSITLGPYKKYLREFYRILKPSGKLYFNAADLGWFIYNILEQHNPSMDFSPRDWAINTISNTINYYATGEFNQNTSRESILMPLEIVKKEIGDYGFEILDFNSDGKINFKKTIEIESFFPGEKYGLTAVYEILASKKRD